MPELTWKQAIEKVLTDRGEPMRYDDIAEAIMEAGLRETAGATPTATVAAQLSMEIDQQRERSLFVRVSRATYGLRAWQNANLQSAAVLEAASDVAIEPGVQAYGMYWDRKLVDWNKSPSKLFGQQFQGSATVDFSEQRGLYLLYDHRSIVYVGRATQTSIGKRLRDHTQDRLRTRWDRFSWFGFCGVKDDGTLIDQMHVSFDLDMMLSQLEAVFIEVAEPPQNRQQGKGLTGIEYLQVEDPSFREHRRRALDELASRL